MPNKKYIQFYSNTKRPREIAEIVSELPGIVFQYVAEPNGNIRFTYVSENAKEIWGFSAEDAYKLGGQVLKNIHPEDMQQYRDAIARSNKEGIAISVPFRVQHDDGRLRWVQANSSPRYLDDGRIVRTGTVIDITESKLIYDDIKASEQDAHVIFRDLDTRNQQLARTKANLLEALDMLPIGLFIKTVGNKFIYANKFYNAIWGFSSLQQLQQAGWGGVRNNIKDWGQISETDNKLVSSGKTASQTDVSIIDSTGNTRYFDVTKCIFQLSPDGEDEILGIMFETTHFRSADAERRKYIADLSERNLKLERFSQIISHNLRAPVTTVMAVTNWMAGNLDPADDNGRILLEGLADATRKIDDVVRDLNDVLAPVQAQSVELVRFNDLIEDVQIPLHKEAGPNGLEIIHDFSGATDIHTVPKYLYNLFHHILATTVRQKRQGHKLTVGIKSERSPEGIDVTLRDNGAGVDMNTYGNLAMELFQMYHSHKETDFKGLPASKKQASILRSPIDINSTPGSGTIIQLRLNDLR
ncbi:MAG: PAS domain-containing protein [Flavipsychrobacter sp.]|nr:PAS domain-containing protein [Flavipsychrobacter sp.]